MPNYKIRLVYSPGENKPEILETVAKLDNTLFSGCSLEASNKNYWWFVFDSDNNVIGYAGMVYLTDEKYGYFSRAGILASHRGNNLHKRLITARIKKAKKIGGEGVLTYVRPTNNASMNSLIARGFRLYTPPRRWAGTEFVYLQLSF
jgi:ribosomal protein S18 acetylase RimI-like enzyme